VPGRTVPTYGGIALIAAASLMLEILLTRITSVIAWYHLAFFMVSLAMLGMTAGAVLVFVRPGWFPAARVHVRMAQASAAFAVTVPLGLALAMQVPMTDPRGSLVTLLAYGSALAVPFLASGVALTLALTRAGLPAGLAYGVDLLGAAAGCWMVIPLLGAVDAPSAALVAAALGAAAAATFAQARATSGAALALSAALATAALANAQADPPPLRPQWVKGLEEDPRTFGQLRWNTYSRVSVDRTAELPPILWGPGRNAPAELLTRVVPQRFVRIDGAAGTTMAALDLDPTDGRPGTAADHDYLAWDVVSAVHDLRPAGPAAVIGVGGGRDVLDALRVGHTPVVAVELNAAIVDLHRGELAAFSGIAAQPGVDLITDEARSYFARDTATYQTITMSLIDTWASTGAGAYALSENGLYTREAWQTFMARLQPGGVFTVSRWYYPASPGETARMVSLAMETLWSMGVEQPRQHLALLQSRQVATLLVARDPLSDSDISRLQQLATTRGFALILSPRRVPVQPLLAELAAVPDRAALWAWARAQALDVTPPTDERPFFFNMIRPRDWLRTADDVDALDLAFLGNLQATGTLLRAIAASALLTLAAIVVPLLARRRDLRGQGRGRLVAACGYFAAIGIGFMFVEIGLLSRLSVYLGHPTLALAVLLGGVIATTGLGSLASSWVPLERRAVSVVYPWIPAAAVALVGALLDPALGATVGWSTSARVLVALALLAVAATPLGLGFPLGLRLVRGDDGRGEVLAPWMWGINGAAGVVASGLALVCSMAFGVSTTLWLGAGAYALLPLATRALLARR
jgi:spermidine synthase